LGGTLKRVIVVAVLTGLWSTVLVSQLRDTAVQASQNGFGRVVPVSGYVRLMTGERIIAAGVRVSLTHEEISRLRIVFMRDSLGNDDGPQYLRILTSLTNKNERTLDENTQYAITFHRRVDKSSDLAELRRFSKEIDPISHTNPALIEMVPIQVDTLAEWGHLYVTVEPEQEFVKYYGRIRNKLEYEILIKGGTLEAGLTVSVPKVLYDTRGSDSVSYGKTSAMLRVYFLNAETGMRYPFNLGIGTFGVDSPIDVSRTGGGFAFSIYFDVVQFFRLLDYNLSYGFNAGFDVSPFFPIGHKARMLFNARLGISP
jgi:hypothetical protein